MEQDMNIIITIERLMLPYEEGDWEDESLWAAPYFSNPPVSRFSSNADLMAKFELLRKIGRINFTKFLQVIYSSKKFVKEYSFGDLRNILLYEKWILQKKTAYIVLQKSKTKTNNYLPTEIIEQIVGYLEFDDLNYKVWINKTEAYQGYENAKMIYEHYNSMTLNFMRKIVEKYGDPNKDSITNKIILSNPEYWKKVRAPEIKDMLRYFMGVGVFGKEMGIPYYYCRDKKGKMIEKLTKYIKKNISPQEFKSYYTKENIKFYSYHKKEADKNLTTIFSTTYWSSKPVKELRLIVKKQNWKGKTTNKQETMQTIIRNLKKNASIA